MGFTRPLPFLVGAFLAGAFAGFPGLLAFFIDSILRFAPVFSPSLSKSA
jgi:hypothetical protein